MFFSAYGSQAEDTIVKLVIFLAKTDGIDKVVKTLQYIGKLAYYNLEGKNPILAAPYRNLEMAAGLSRKVFRGGRTLTGFNALRSATYPDLTIQLLTIFGYSGEMVYSVWLFDHVKIVQSKIAAIKMQRVMSVMSIVARTSDLLVALSVVNTNPFVSHTLTLGLSGLASGWAGWYRQWPEST